MNQSGGYKNIFSWRLTVGMHRLMKGLPHLTRLLVPIFLLLAVSLACAVPVFQQQPESQLAGPTTPAVTPAQVEGTLTAVPQVQFQARETAPVVQSELPPALIEVDPLPRSALSPGSDVVMYFNQPMNRASVEAALEIEPELPARLEWIDDATLRLIPERLPDEGLAVHINVTADARATNGQTLAAPVQIAYAAPGPLLLTEQLPAPGSTDVNPSSAIVVTFNRPVVALGADSGENPPAFSLDPPAVGRGEWLNTSTYIFYPGPALAGGVQYTVILNSALVAGDGSPLQVEAPALNWSFTTVTPALLSVIPSTEQPIELDASFTLTFNQPMDPASVESAFVLTRDETALPGAFTWNDTATEITFTPSERLERGSGYNLVLSGSALSQGSAALGQDFAASLVTVAQFGVVQTRPAAGETLSPYAGYGSIELNFSSPVSAGQNLNRLVSLVPPVVDQAVTRSPDGYQIYLSGYFQPGASYTLEVSPGLRDKWDAALDTPYSFTFTTSPAQRALFIPALTAGATVFVPQWETSIPAHATNIERLDLSRGALTLAEYIQAEQNWQGLQNWEARVQANWTRLLYPTPDTSEPVEIPLEQANQPLQPGLYFLNIDTGPVQDAGAVSAPLLLVVSPIQITLKTSLNQAFVWAVQVADNQPAAGVEVTFYDGTAHPAAACLTDEDGVCQVDLPEAPEAGSGVDSTYYAVIGQPGDADFSLAAADWNQGVSPWQFSLPYARAVAEPQVYLYTDRPIYRPGQAVNFRAVVRDQDNGRYALAPLPEITIDVVSPYDPIISQSRVLTTLSLPLSPYGTASGIYNLPEDAHLGSYTLRVRDTQFQDVFFQVAEYRKPEIDLQVAFQQLESLFGDNLQVQVMAGYFFGAPAGNLPIRWTLFGDSAYPGLPGGLQAGLMDTGWLDPWGFAGPASFYITEGEARTRPDGSLEVDIPGDLLRERLEQFAGRPIDLTFEATIVDESGLPVSARRSLRQHPSDFYIGVRPEQWSVSTREEITYYIRSVDWQAAPAAAKPLEAHFSKVTWIQQESADPATPPVYRMETFAVGSTEFVTSENGEARLAFEPAEPGTYMLEVTGEGQAVTQVLIWVGGPGSAAWPGLPNQRLFLRSDGEQYQAGDQARIFIPNPFDGEALALVAIERGEVMRSQVIAIEGASYELVLPLNEEDAPNIYVSVTLIGKTNGRPDFRVGYVELSVEPAEQLLQLDVQFSPPEPRPGGEITINIRAHDAAGIPVQGEFSLALVDKAVLALADPNTPSIIDAFYGKQPLGVQSGYALAAYGGRSIYLPPGRGGGGAAEDMFAQPTVRERFADTAFWSGTIETDVTGVAQLILTLPDNLTTWQTDVRGLTTETQVGQAQVDLITSKPLLIRPLTPRYTVLGDHFEMAAVVHNNTGDSLRVSVRLEGAGFTLDDLNTAVQPVEIQAGGQSRVGWWGTVQDVPALDLTFSAEAGVLEDAARPENGLLPVLRYAAPQTFGATGVLDEPGSRLELISIPRSFTPAGGEVRLELAPSLSAAVLDGLQALEAFPRDFIEPVLSRMLPNLVTYRALRDLQLENEALRTELESAIAGGVDRLAPLQNEDGGWGWAANAASDAYLSSYVLFGLTQAAEAGLFVDPQVIKKGQDYLLGVLFDPSMATEPWQLDRLAFQHFALQQSNQAGSDLAPLLDFQEKLSPWGKAFLALTLESRSAGDSQARAILSDLQSSASRTDTGASWRDPSPAWHNWSTPNFTTAVVAYTIARLDPGSPLLSNAVRYLVHHRRPDGAWASSYESAWVLLAMVETMRGTGEVHSDFSYAGELNGSPLVAGRIGGPASSLNPITSSVPLSSLLPDAPNSLSIQRGEGLGRLFYRAYLQVSRPVEDVPPVERGLSLVRQYYHNGQDCRQEECSPVSEVDLSDPQPLLVRLTLTVSEDMYYVVVEDVFPAGAEALNPRLKTTQQNFTPENLPPAGGQTAGPYNLANPFEEGWGWWLFQDPQVSDDRIRWVADYLPAGVYELTYRLSPFLAGEFRLIPARAYQYYFPEVEAASAGGLLIIR